MDLILQILETAQPLVGAFLPDLLIILLGAILARLVKGDIWRGLDWLTYYVLVPSLLFVAAAGRAIPLDDVLYVAIFVWALMGFALIIAAPGRRLGKVGRLDYAGIWQTAWRFNTALAFVGAAAFPGDVRGILAVAIGLAVPPANLFAVGVLARGNGLSPGTMIKAVFTNPFLLASGAGLVFGITGTELPSIPNAMVNRLSDAALPLTLLSMGAALDFRALGRLSAQNLYLHTIKLIVLPGIVLTICLLTGATGPLATAMVVFASLPTAAAAHILADQFGASRSLAANVVVQSTCFGCLGMAVWITVAGHLLMVP